MSFMDAIKHAVLTDDDPSLKPAEPVNVVVNKERIPTPGAPKISFQTSSLVHQTMDLSANVPSDARSIPPTGRTDMYAQADAAGNTIYAQSLKDKTDFDKTDVGKQVAHEMKPLEGIASLTESDKINIALKAGAEEGLTAEKIIATFDSLLQTLESENSGFQTAVTAATQSGPEAIKAQIQAEADKIVDLEAQITAARAKQSDLSTELIKASTKIQTNTMQFNAAYEARKSELTSAKSHYQSILSGIK